MTEDRLTQRDRVTTHPKILVGKPATKGVQVAVELLLADLTRNPDFGESLLDFPEITMDEVQACLAYAQSLAAGENATPPPRRRTRGRAIHQSG